jgi:hypothetical protein
MTKVKGSKSGQVITASFDGESKQRFPDLSKTKALVLLSIKGNQYCEGNYLDAIIQHAISTYGFTTFLIADEVYWHNLKKSDFDPKQEIVLRQAARHLGIEFFENNLQYFLKPLNITITNFNKTHENKNSLEKVHFLNTLAKASFNFEILLWQDWVNDEEYQKKEKVFFDLYHSIYSLKMSINNAAINYVDRRVCTQFRDFDLQNSKAYLIEESPAIIWVGAKRGYNFIVYAGEMVESLIKTKEFLILDKNSSPPHPYCIQVEKPHTLINWLEVNFKRAHAKKSSSFFSKHPSTMISEIVKGITLAIFSLPCDETKKIELLINFTTEYLKKIDDQKITENPIEITSTVNSFMTKVKKELNVV